MTLKRWLFLIMGLALLGCLQVAQRTALFLKGYELGAKDHQVHLQETEVSWLRNEVIALVSPVRLAEQTKTLVTKANATTKSRKASGRNSLDSKEALHLAAVDANE